MPLLHRRFYTKILSHTEPFINKRLHRHKHTGTHNISILPQFLALDPHFVRKRCRRPLKITILPRFLTVDLHFVRKVCRRPLKITILLKFLTIDPHFVRKGCRRPLKITILLWFLTASENHYFYLHFGRWTIVSCERGAIDTFLDGTALAVREKKN